MLKFATFISDIELPFYTSLASLKLNHDKLDDSARRVLGLYETRPSDPPHASCRLQLHSNALTSDSVPAGFCRAEGVIKNVNTAEEYKNLDRGAIISQSGRTIWDAIHDGTIYSCPSLLASFLVICFADLKKYKFTYQFAFPVLHSEPSWIFDSESVLNIKFGGYNSESNERIQKLDALESASLVECVQTWRYGVDARQYGFFLAKKTRYGEDGKSCEPPDKGNAKPEPRSRSTTPDTPYRSMGFIWVVASLASFDTEFFAGTAAEDQFVCFVDPSTYSTHPGWMLRNLLVLIGTRWKLNKVQVLCYRDVPAHRDGGRSIIMRLMLDDISSTSCDSMAPLRSLDLPKITGWERNAAGKVTSKIANLGEYMDPKRLADQAVDLNLKLIKWRIAPELNLEKIKNTKCLLLGAGTLGGYVARNLLAWGVRKITFVDNGSVAFSNPVRQPLFSFQDCLAGGAKKAHRASESLSEIYPGVDTEGFVLSVPMAGHPIVDELASKADFETLKQLIDEHDAIFLLMDSRESRWLPTVMGKAADKIVMNAALGFDTFLVMRHGLRNQEQPTQELGCYFCNDVVAPVDSLTDRTLDQQCTVTRPGIAALASALLVEVFVSLLQHTQGFSAPAPVSHIEDRGSHPLGLVPHQIRGFLSSFQNIIVRGKSYESCSACSEKVVSAYRSQGWQFVSRALNEKGFVEELSGLAEVQRIAEVALVEVEWSDGESVVGEDREDF